MKRLIFIILSFTLFPALVMGQQQEKEADSLVEVSGVVLTADSLLKIPGVSVHIEGTDRGVAANGEGVFSIVAERGDTLAFSVVGFKSIKKVVPDNMGKDYLSFAVLLSQDTTYLPPMVVHSYPSKEEFAEAFLHWKIPDNFYELAKANTATDILRSQMYFVAPDGKEGVGHTFQRRFQQMKSRGQMPAMNIFNPLAWAEFIKSIKDGDYKSKD